MCYDAWKDERRAARRRQRRSLRIEEPPCPYIQSMPLEVLDEIMKRIDKSAWLSMRSVNSFFRAEITKRFRTLTRVDMAEFLPAMFAIEAEKPVSLILSNLVNVQELTVPGTVLRVLRSSVVEKICQLKKLKKLDMNNCFISSWALRKLTKRLPQIEELCLRNTKFTYRDIDFKNRRESRAVAYLTFIATALDDYSTSYSSFQEISDRVVGKLISWKNLRKLDLRGCVVENSILYRILFELPKLEVILIEDPRTVQRLERELGGQVREQGALTIMQDLNNNGLSELSRRLDNLKTLTLMNWNASDSSVKHIMEKCIFLHELRFKLGYRPPDGSEPYFGSTTLITDYLPHPEHLRVLALYNMQADSNWASFFTRCYCLRELTIEPMLSEADFLDVHVVFKRSTGYNLLKVPPRLFKMFTKWNRNMSPLLASFVICEIQPLYNPYEVNLSVSDTFTMPALPDYSSNLRNMLYSLYKLGSLRVLRLIWKKLNVDLLDAIPDAVLHNIEVLDLWFGFDTPVSNITTLIERLCGRFRWND
ncbi:hypothetical protein TTRE_0000258801 [Trichuris trichiura]|uniref:F-box domain-containing protein n=1 Tax=Trichuris trichiura TaxID=36087 RepID=A0A077Z3R6_TRITR|nr:hypothetical protein TTRE_0000258801 [Trichuris trichiura]